jgi:hypothetical protein
MRQANDRTIPTNPIPQNLMNKKAPHFMVKMWNCLLVEFSLARQSWGLF